jgi:hypothetical protein
MVKIDAEREGNYFQLVFSAPGKTPPFQKWNSALPTIARGLFDRHRVPDIEPLQLQTLLLDFGASRGWYRRCARRADLRYLGSDVEPAVDRCVRVRAERT